MAQEIDDWIRPADDAPVEPSAPPPQEAPVEAQPVNDWVRPQEPQQLGFWESLGNSAERGARSLYRNWQGLPGQLEGLAFAEDVQRRIAAGEDSVLTRRFRDNPELLETFRQQYAENAAEALPIVAQQNQAIQNLPQHPAAEAMQRAKTWGEAWDHFTSAPISVIANIGLESLVQQAPGLAAGVVAGAAGGVPALMATIGLGSAHTEYMGGIFSALAEEGVDITNPEALRAALLDQELMGRVRHQSAVKAGVVGLFDAGSAGLASRVLLPAATLASRPVARHLTNVGVQVPVQGAMGGAGEALGSVASGQEVSPGAVMGEIVGEAFGAPAEVAGARHARRPAAPAPQPPTPTVDDWVRPADDPVPAPVPVPSSGPQAAITGFYSPAERAVTELPRKQGPAQAWFNDLKKRGISDDELDWMGFAQWMEENKGRPISREEMVEFIRENGADLVELRQEGSSGPTREEIGLEHFGLPWDQLNVRQQYWAMARADNKVKFKSNFPAGVTNPRNFLVRLPGLNYDSPHFGGPTISFIRVADTVGPNGEKTLLVHGNQSELHQEAEKGGYQKAGDDDAVSIKRDFERVMQDQLTYSEANAVNDVRFGTALDETLQKLRVSKPDAMRTVDAYLRLERQGMESSMPNAPLKGDRWWQLGLKLALRQAVAEGYDAVAISTGDQVAATDGNAPKSLYDQKMPTWLGKYVRPMGGEVATTVQEVIEPKRFTSLESAIRHFGPEATIPDLSPHDRWLVVTPERRLFRRSQPVTVGEIIFDAVRPSYLISQSTDPNVKNSAITRHTFIRPTVLITPKMRESISKGQPLFAGSGIETKTDADRYEGVERLLRLKRPNNILPSIQTEVLDTIESNPYSKMIPPDVDRAVLARIEPIAGTNIDQAVAVWFKTPDGEMVSIRLPFRQLKRMRAFVISGDHTSTGRDLTGFLRLGRPVGGLRNFIAGEYRHEAVHILRNRNLLNGSVWFRLVDHALSLGVDKLSIRTAQQKMGDDAFIYTDPSVTIEDTYREDLYAGYANLEEMLDQEYVAYMLELHHHGHFSDADVAPVMDIIKAMEAGVFSGHGTPSVPTGPSMAIAGERAPNTVTGEYTGAPMFAVSGGPRIPSALSFIREHGGIKDENGELKAILDRPGRGSKGYLVGIVNNKTGVPLDRMRELMVEAGYIQRTPDDRPDKTSIRDVLDIIRRVKDGEKVVPLWFESELADERDSAIESENRDGIIREAESILTEHGMPYNLSETEESRIVELVDGGMSVDDAMERALIETIHGRDESEAAATDSGRVEEDGGQAPEGEFGEARPGDEGAVDDRSGEARAEGSLPAAVTPPPIPSLGSVPPPVPPGSSGGTGGRGGGRWRSMAGGPPSGGGKPPGGGTTPLAIGGPSPIDAMPDGALKRAFFKLQETFQDAEIRALKLVQRVEDARNVGRGGLSDDADPYLRMTLYHGRVGTKMEQGYDKVRELADGMQNLAEKLGTNTLAVRKRINFYLHAQHAPERNRVHGPDAAGMSDAYAARVIAAAKKEAWFPDLKRLADMAEQINGSTLTLLADGRVISPELYGKLTDTYRHHVPLNRIFEGTEDVGGALSGRGFDVVGAGVKRAKGSDRDVDDILTNIVTNFEQAVLRSEKNIVDLATLKFMRENLGHMNGRIEITKPKVIGTTHEGLPITEQTSNPRILQLREDGKPVWIKFKDKELAVAFRGANKDTPPRIFRPVIAFTRLYAGLSTRFNPEFAFPNKLRDLQETLIHLSAQNKIGAKGALEALTTDMRQSLKDIVDYQRGLDTPGARLYQELKDRGGTTGGFGLSTREQVELHLSQIEKIAASPTRQNIEKFIEAVDAWNTIFEDSTRLSVYRTALNAGLSKDRAAAMAKEASINFNRQGTASPVTNGLWMFSNASIQGTTKMLRAMRNPKVATAVGLMVGLAVAAATEWNDWIDKDWRQKITKWDRLNGLNIMLPSPVNGIHYISIPIAWGVKPIMVMANYAVDAARGVSFTMADMGKDVIAAMLQAYNPVGGTDITSAITPTILDVPSEIARNQKWSGARIRPTTDQNAPSDTQYFGTLKDTAGGRLAIGATRGLQEYVGLTISPADLHYAIEQYAGGAGRSVLRLSNLVAGLFTGEPSPVREWPFISRFYKSLTDEEIGRSATRGPAQRAREALEQDSRRRFLLRDQADDIFRSMAGLDAQQAEARFNEINDTNQPLARELARIIQYRNAALTATERRIIQMDVNNGSRARYLVSEVLQGLTGEALEDKLAELRAKRIVTNQVAQQIYAILDTNTPPEPRNRRFRAPDWSRWRHGAGTQSRQQQPPGDWVRPQDDPGDWVRPVE